MKTLITTIITSAVALGNTLPPTPENTLPPSWEMVGNENLTKSING